MKWEIINKKPEVRNKGKGVSFSTSYPHSSENGAGIKKIAEMRKQLSEKLSIKNTT